MNANPIVNKRFGAGGRVGRGGPQWPRWLALSPRSNAVKPAGWRRPFLNGGKDDRRRELPAGMRGFGAFRKTGHVGWRLNSGLSLLEMLVVLVLTALLSTLLIQGLGLFLSGTESVRRHSGTAAAATLPQRWFTATVSGMMPYLDPERAFTGDGSAFEGLTLASLTDEPGLPRRIRWSITADGLVRYAEIGELGDEGLEWTILHTPGTALAFEYAGRNGGWRNLWRASPNERQWIPSQVRLVADGGRVLWLARLSLHPVPVVNFRRS